MEAQQEKEAAGSRSKEGSQKRDVEKGRSWGLNGQQKMARSISLVVQDCSEWKFDWPPIQKKHLYGN